MPLVFVPTWNSATTLEGTLRSIKIAIPNASIVVIDRGSADNTKRIALKYGKYVNFNGNIGETRTLMCKMAQERPEWFVMVDSDMVLPENWFREVTRYKDENVGAIFTRKFSVTKKIRAFEMWRQGSLVFPAVNITRMDTACVYINPKAVAGFKTTASNQEDKQLGDYIIKQGFKHVFVNIIADHYGNETIHNFWQHARWDGAGRRKIIKDSTLEMFLASFVMPLKAPPRLMLFTFKTYLQEFIGYLLANYYFEYKR